MKIYSINYSFDNGEYYDLHLCDNGVINYYATKELAIEEFNKIDPQNILDEYTCWMHYTNIESYTLDAKLNDYGLPEHYYEVGDCYFDYEVVEIDVVEDNH